MPFKYVYSSKYFIRSTIQLICQHYSRNRLWHESATLNSDRGIYSIVLRHLRKLDIYAHWFFPKWWEMSKTPFQTSYFPIDCVAVVQP